MSAGAVIAECASRVCKVGGDLQMALSTKRIPKQMLRRSVTELTAVIQLLSGLLGEPPLPNHHVTEVTMDLRAKITARIRRIDAVRRWSRMNGWGGMIGSQLEIEQATLKALLE